MRHTEFWARLERAQGRDYARFWSTRFVVSELDGRTVVEALDSGMPPKQVWAAVWRVLELPETER